MIRSMRRALPALLLAGAAGAQQPANAARSETAGAASASTSAPTYTAARTPAVIAPATATAAQPQPAGPTMDRASAGIRPSRGTATAAKATPLPRREDSPRNRALMIVGGAALLTGAIIGDDAGTIVMLGGAGIGLWGLWKYLE